MSKKEKEQLLMMDRAIEELTEFNARFEKALTDLESHCKEMKSLKEKMSDLLTIAVNWKAMAEIDGVDIGQ